MGVERRRKRLVHAVAATESRPGPHPGTTRAMTTSLGVSTVGAGVDRTVHGQAVQAVRRLEPFGRYAFGEVGAGWDGNRRIILILRLLYCCKPDGLRRRGRRSGPG